LNEENVNNHDNPKNPGGGTKTTAKSEKKSSEFNQGES